MAGPDQVNRGPGTDGVLNTILGAAATAGGLLPGVGGLVGGIAGIGSGVYGTATSDTGSLDQAVNAVGTWGGIAALPATIAGMMGVGTGVTMGGLSTVGTGLGASAAATTAGGAALGGAAVAGNLLAAGAAGYGVGSLAAHTTDTYGKGGIFGTDEWGRERSNFDWSADQGIAVDKFFDGWAPDVVGDVAGGVTAAGLGILSTPAGIGTAIGNGISSLWD